MEDRNKLFDDARQEGMRAVASIKSIEKAKLKASLEANKGPG